MLTSHTKVLENLHTNARKFFGPVEQKRLRSNSLEIGSPDGDTYYSANINIEKGKFGIKGRVDATRCYGSKQQFQSAAEDLEEFYEGSQCVVTTPNNRCLTVSCKGKRKYDPKEYWGKVNITTKEDEKEYIRSISSEIASEVKDLLFFDLSSDALERL